MAKRKNELKPEAFIKKGKVVLTESEVEDLYIKFLNIELTKYGYTDGVDEGCLFEFKKNSDLYNKNFSKVTAQACAYIKKIQLGEYDVPENEDLEYTILLDENEAIIIPILELDSYLQNKKYDWNRPPSSPDDNLIKDLQSFDKTKLKYFKLDSADDAKDFRDYFKNLSKGNYNFKIDITEHNFINIFKKWHNIIGKRIKEKDEDLKYRKSVDYFMMDLQNNVTINNSKKCAIVTYTDHDGRDSAEKIPVIISDYNIFWNKYTRPSNIVYNLINNNKDEMMEIISRRKQGEYFTPLNIVEKEVKRAQKIWDTDFSDHKIWDMCCGTGNLLKRFTFNDFSNCYLSTINSGDISHMNTLNMFKDATKFQYDFLNQEDKDLPENLLNDLKNPDNKWLFILNPPYKGSTTKTKEKHDIKSTITKTNTYNKMKKDNHITNKGCVRDLSVQFLYNILMIKQRYNLNLKIVIFNPLLTILCKPIYKDIKKLLLNNFYLHNEINTYHSKLFGTSGKFSITCSLWDLVEKDTNLYKFKLYDKNINYIGDFNIKSDIKNYLTECVNRCLHNENKIKNIKTIPMSSNGINIYKSKINKDYIKYNSIATIVIGGNDFSRSSLSFITTSCYGNGYGVLSILKKYFQDWCMIYTIRKSPKVKWYNNQFPYFEPDYNHEKYPEFRNDSVIFTIFNVNNNATSVALEYENKLYDIRNNFFWMTRNDLKDVDMDGRIYNDLMSCKRDPWAARWIKVNGHKLSKESKELLDVGRKLVLETMEYRNMDDIHQLLRWDSGFTQIRKGILENKNYKNKTDILYDEFKEKRKKLEDKCRSTAEELGCWWKVEMYDEMK